MTTKQHIVQLTSRELMYLKNSGFLAQALAHIVNAALDAGNDRYTLIVSREVAEEFRSAFTDHLARVGFDASYELTSEGRILEELIDRFYLA